MSKRFGRNQKRCMRERIQALEDSLALLRHKYRNGCWRVHRLNRRVHYLESVPVSARVERQERRDRYGFMMELDRDKLHDLSLRRQDLEKIVSQEILGAILNHDELRHLIVEPVKPRNYQIGNTLSPSPSWIGHDLASKDGDEVGFHQLNKWSKYGE